MRQEFHKGDTVEVWIDGDWQTAVIDLVWRCASIPDGKRSYMYTVVYDGGNIDAEFTVKIDQAEIRRPGERNHTERVFGPVKKRRVLRANKVKGAN